MIITTLVLSPRARRTGPKSRSALLKINNNGKLGSDSMMSVKRINTVSAMPPKYPATLPTEMPITIESVVAISDTLSETRPA